MKKLDYKPTAYKQNNIGKHQIDKEPQDNFTLGIKNNMKTKK